MFLLTTTYGERAIFIPTLALNAMTFSENRIRRSSSATASKATPKVFTNLEYEAFSVRSYKCDSTPQIALPCTSSR